MGPSKRRLSHLKMVVLCDQQYGGMEKKWNDNGIVSTIKACSPHQFGRQNPTQYPFLVRLCATHSSGLGLIPWSRVLRVLSTARRNNGHVEYGALFRNNAKKMMIIVIRRRRSHGELNGDLRMLRRNP